MLLLGVLFNWQFSLNTLTTSSLLPSFSSIKALTIFYLVHFLFVETQKMTDSLKVCFEDG